MILYSATDGWDDVTALLDSLPYEAKKDIVASGLAWALCNIADEDEDELPDDPSELHDLMADDPLFEELGRIGTCLALRRAGLLVEPCHGAEADQNDAGRAEPGVEGDQG